MDYLNDIAEDTRVNRDLLVGFCKVNDLNIMNTYFDKPLDKQVTYREIGVESQLGVTATSEFKIT